ncbi:hypothetical protein Sjap_005664 [Stephania japonica]|uniref:Uncharacterized protein n=1 Tax=Stephania japonica TaxID=461633 RepID=A0AAP0K4P9_9MAGN
MRDDNMVDSDDAAGAKDLILDTLGRTFRSAVEPHDENMEDDGEETPVYRPVDVEVCAEDIVVLRIDNKLQLVFSNKLMDQMAESMKNTVMIRMLGREIGLQTLQQILFNPWNPKGVMNEMDLENGYFIARYRMHVDYCKRPKNILYLCDDVYYLYVLVSQMNELCS